MVGRLQDLSGAGVSAQKPREPRLRDLKTQIFGDVAVVTGVQAGTGATNYVWSSCRNISWVERVPTSNRASSYKGVPSSR